jgi:hypothetical protein
MAHGDVVGNTLVMDGNELASARRHTKRRMHKEDARRADMLCLERAKRVHGMMMDTDKTLVVIDPFNNQGNNR